MRVLVQDNSGIKSTVATRLRAEGVHLHSRRVAVRGRGHIRVIDVIAVVEVQPVLGLSADGIARGTATIEIIILEVAGGFGETETIESIMHPVNPEKELNRGGIPVVAWSAV